MQPTRPTCSSNCLCLAHPKPTSRLKFSDRSFRNAAPSLLIKLPTTVVPSSQKQLISTHYYFRHLPHLVNNFLIIARYIFSLSPFLHMLLSHLSSTFAISLLISCNFIECERIYQSSAGFVGTLICCHQSIYPSIRHIITMTIGEMLRHFQSKY